MFRSGTLRKLTGNSSRGPANIKRTGVGKVAEHTPCSAEALSNCSHLQSKGIDKLCEGSPAKRPPMMPSSWEKKGIMLDLKFHAHYRQQKLGI